MSFINVDFNSAVEAQPAPEGRYSLQITDGKVVQTGPNSANPGRDMLQFTIGFTDPEVNAPTIRHFVSLPHSDDEPQKARNKALMLKRFLVAFDIPFESNGIDLDAITFEAIGKEAHDIHVTQDTGQDGVSVYNRINLPRLPRE